MSAHNKYDDNIIVVKVPTDLVIIKLYTFKFIQKKKNIQVSFKHIVALYI